jgi:hypothetical protein
VVLTALALVATLGFKLGTGKVMLGSALLGLAWKLLFQP